MLKKSITYTSLFTDEEVTEEHYFHISKADLIELETSVDGGFYESLKSVVEEGTTNPAVIIREVKKIILMAVGRRSEDGKRFIKNREIRDEFEQSEAFSELYAELCTNAESALEFTRGILPTNLAQQAEGLARTAPRNGVVSTSPDPGVLPGGDGRKSETEDGPEAKPQLITRRELEELPKDQYLQKVAEIAAGDLVIAD